MTAVIAALFSASMIAARTKSVDTPMRIEPKSVSPVRSGSRSS